MNRKYFPLLLLSILILAIPLTVFIAQKQQETRQRASEVVVGNLVLNATFHSIGIEVKNTTATTGTLEFKKATDSLWRKGIDMWQAGGALYGSVLMLEPGTSYDVKISYESQVAQGQITTRVDNIPPANTLTPTHYVRVDGNDSNSGTSDSPTGAWKTLYKAMTAAPTGAIVQVGPGRFTSPGVVNKDLVRSLPITFKAQFPAMDNNGNVINQGNHSIVDQGAYTSPANSSDQNAGVWQRVPYTGPATGQQYQIWKWNTSQYTPNEFYGIDGAQFSTTRDGETTRIALWERKSGTATDSTGKVFTMATPEGFTELLYTNKSYSYGFGWFGNGDMLLRLPKDVNPNTLYIHMSINAGNGTRAFHINAPNSRVTGFRGASVRFSVNANNGMFDHNYRGTIGVFGAYPGTYAKDIVIEHNKFVDTNLWSTDPSENCFNNCPTGHATSIIPWDFIKGNVKLGDGTGTSWGRIGASAENGGVGFNGGGHNVVVRNNVIDGYFNGVGAYNANYDRYATMNTDVYNNLITRTADDAFEPEQVGINWRIWNNTIKETFIGFSTGPLAYGPLFLFRNTFWEVNGVGAGVDNSGMFTGIAVGPNGEKGGQVFKFSGNSNPKARVWVINNTFWTSRCCSGGGDQWAGGGTNPENFYLINNIFRTTQYVGGLPGFENNNQFATTDTTRGIDRKYTTNVTQYRTDYATTHDGQTTTSNVLWDGTTGHFIDTAIIDTNLSDPSSSNLSLKTGSAFIDKGVVVPNIADSFAGTAPDLGAMEFGSSSFPTFTPTPSGPTTPPSPTATRTPTPTTTTVPQPSGTLLSLTLKFHGLGNGGDVVNPTSQGNMTPLRTTRPVTVEMYSALNNQLVGTATGNVLYNGQTGIFTGTIQAPSAVTTTGYNLRVTSQGYLVAQQLGVFVTQNQTNTVPTLALTTGDINNDKTLDILDYNILVSCYGSVGSTAPSTCIGQNNVAADLFDDGNVNFIDLNLWLREFSKKS